MSESYLFMDLLQRSKHLSQSYEELDRRLETFIDDVSGRALVMMENACYGRCDVAMDLVQEAFIALHQNYSNKSKDEWYPLFYTILNNKLTDWRRKEARRSQRFGWLKRNPLYFEDQEIDVVDDQQMEPSQQLLHDLNQEEIISAIRSLPVRQQQAFLLRAWEGFDTKTTAQIMNCSEGSVKTHYHRAVQSLKESLIHLNQNG